MIANIIPYLVYHEGEWINCFFVPDNIIANAGNVWDKNRGCVTGAYADEFDFSIEAEPLITEAIEYVTANKDNTKPNTKYVRPIPENL